MDSLFHPLTVLTGVFTSGKKAGLLGRCDSGKVVILMLLLLGFTQFAAANTDEATFHFDLPAQPANISLMNLARITGRNLLYPFDAVSRYRTNKVSGRYTVDKALDLLLQNTGLVISRSERGNTIVKIAKSSLADLSKIQAPGFDETLPSEVFSDKANRLVIEEVLVSAQKRAESVQDVPIALQAFSGKSIGDLGVQKASDITKLAPNMNIATQNAMSQQVVIRGVGTNDFFGNAPGSVGLYIDEITMSAPFFGALGLYDMERVEVLRGPQNSLFGRNTTGGAINYISVQPDVGGQSSGYLSAVYGSHNRLEFEGAVSLIISDTLALRVAGKAYQRDGIWNNLDNGDHEYGDQDRDSFRATLRWEPADHTSVTFNYHNAFEDSESLPTLAVGANHPESGFIGLAFPGPDVDFDQRYNSVNHQGINVSTGNWQDIYKTGVPKTAIDLTGGYLKVVRDFENFSLSVITSYDDFHTLYSEDDGTSGNLRGGLNNDLLVIDMDQAYKQKSAEIRLASSGEGDLRWIVGLYYYAEDALLSQNIRFGSMPSITFGSHLINTLSFSIAKLENRVISPYLHTDYNLTDALTLTVGLRYTKDIKENPVYFGGGLDISDIPPNTFYDRDLTMRLAQDAPVCLGNYLQTGDQRCVGTSSREDLAFREWGGKIGLDWHTGDNMMIYGSYSRGFKSGKHDVEFLHNPYTPFPNSDQDVETLDAWELGFKSDWLGGSMQFNGAVFYYVWKDQQVLNVSSQGPEFLNMPESEIVGLEMEFKWRPAEHWTISGGVGYMESEITDATGVSIAQEGHELPLVTDFSANALIRYDATLFGGIISLQTDMQYRGPAKARFAPDVAIDEYDAMFEINARAAYTFGDARQYEVAVYAGNITEEKRCLQKENLAAIAGVYYCMPNEGIRTFGIQGEITF